MSFQVTKKLLESLSQAILSDNKDRVLSLIENLMPIDIAGIINQQDVQVVKKFCSYLPKEQFASILTEIEDNVRDDLLALFSSEEIATQFIANLASDDAVDIIGQLSNKKQKEVISYLKDIEQASHIIDLLHYDENTAGGLMAKELVKIKIDWNITTCIKELRDQAEDKIKVFIAYVVDDNDILQGRMSLKRMIITSGTKKVKDIYTDNIISVKTDMHREDVAQIMEKYNLVVLPVVDEIGKLVGSISIDDVLDVIKEEAEKDYQMASGISEKVEASDKVWALTRARIPWLLVGLFGGVLGSRVIAFFEGQIMLYPAMAFFIPLIAAMAGNVGVQSSAIVMQGLANNSIMMNKVWSRLGKELLVGLLNGLICSILIFGYNFFFSDSFILAVVVAVSLLSVIVFAAIFGTIVPLLLHRYKIDPALATGPFITTVNDIVGLFLYFSISYFMYSIY